MILLKIPHNYKCHLCFDDYTIEPVTAFYKGNNLDLEKTLLIFKHSSNSKCLNANVVIETKLEDFLVSDFI